MWKDGGTLVLATFTLLPHLDQWSLHFPRGLHRTGVGEQRALWWEEGWRCFHINPLFIFLTHLALDGPPLWKTHFPGKDWVAQGYWTPKSLEGRVFREGKWNSWYLIYLSSLCFCDIQTAQLLSFSLWLGTCLHLMLWHLRASKDKKVLSPMSCKMVRFCLNKWFSFRNEDYRSKK